MRAFEFSHRLIDSYARFSRSFSTVRSEDLKAEVDRQYDAGRFWPDGLLSINPRFLQGPTVDDLVASGDLDDATGKIFRFGPTPLRFHRHQAQSIAKARAGQSYVVTTGTGSGKSLCFFVPIVDSIVRARKAGNAPATADLAPVARDRFITKAKEELPVLLEGPIAEFVRSRAQELMQDHARLRVASGSASRVTVEPVLPPDVIGLFTLMPGEA